MAFTLQQQNIENQQQVLQSQGQYVGAPVDSITLGQLRQMVNAPQRAKQSYYDFDYKDEDTIFEEINEFYSFIEADQLAENLRMWNGSFQGDWTTAPYPQRKGHIVFLLENLEHQESWVRYQASRRLLYLLQGCFAESTSPENQLQWIVENANLVKDSQGVTAIVDALKMLCVKYDKLIAISDADLSRINAAPHMRQSWLDEVQAEISMCLGMLYPIIEVFRSDADFAEELMGMEPPLPIYFLSLMSNLGNRSAKNYPSKKLLLVTWKVLLTCLGGQAEQARAKILARELAGLPPLDDSSTTIKSTPVDLQTFREETFVKYPTFSPPPINSPSGLSSSKLAEALTPLPVRNHYVHPDHNSANANNPDDLRQPNSVFNPPGYSAGGPNNFGRPGLNIHQPGGPNGFGGQGMGGGGGMGMGGMGGGMNATPAPTPPPSPKPKKQQYQTDQTKPFVFPFSPEAYISKRMVPYAIDEADELYEKHLYVSLALFQIWRTREDYLLDESGLEAFPGESERDRKMKRWSVVKVRKTLNASAAGQYSAFSGMSSSAPMGDGTSANGGSGEGVQGEEQEDDDEVVTWPDSKVLEEALERAEKDLRELDRELARMDEDSLVSPKKAERRRAKERRDDLLRLQRAETIYSATLPFLSGFVVVLLKFLITINSITSAQANQNPAQSNMFSNPQMDVPPPQVHHTVEEIDALRHREIMIKGLSAFLLLLLKWFKRSHIMKYHHLAFTLLSAGTHVHILRLLTYTEVSAYVVTKNEVPDRSFFRYCYERFSPNAPHVPAEDLPIFAPRQPARPSPGGPGSGSISMLNNGSNPDGPNGPAGNGDEEIEMITDFSWRNFFAVINAVKIMHKITKGNPTRILQLVHHKTSAILKRMMRISHPVLQLQLLKLIKSQVPYSGRKWKQLNMKIITAIYLHCRPELRDEWLATMEVEESRDSPTNVETFLRRLVAFYDYKRYGYVPPKINSDQHQRSSSLSIADPAMSPEPQASHPLASPAASDVFPPPRSQAADPSIFMPYPSEDLAFEEEYEEYLFDLQHSNPPDMVTTDSAPSWTEIPNDQPIGEGISDSESVVSIGDGLPADNTGPDGKTVLQEDSEVGKNNWEHMSPKTLSALPKSPAKSPAGGGRRSSSGAGLRPVLPFDLDDPDSSSAVDDDEGPEMGPMPIERSTPFAVQDEGRGVDEVEYMYGE